MSGGKNALPHTELVAMAPMLAEAGHGVIGATDVENLKNQWVRGVNGKLVLPENAKADLKLERITIIRPDVEPTASAAFSTTEPTKLTFQTHALPPFETDAVPALVFKVNCGAASKYVPPACSIIRSIQLLDADDTIIETARFLDLFFAPFTKNKKNDENLLRWANLYGGLGAGIANYEPLTYGWNIGLHNTLTTGALSDSDGYYEYRIPLFALCFAGDKVHFCGWKTPKFSLSILFNSMSTASLTAATNECAPVYVAGTMGIRYHHTVVDNAGVMDYRQFIYGDVFEHYCIRYTDVSVAITNPAASTAYSIELTNQIGLASHFIVMLRLVALASRETEILPTAVSATPALPAGKSTGEGAVTFYSMGKKAVFQIESQQRDVKLFDVNGTNAEDFHERFEEVCEDDFNPVPRGQGNTRSGCVVLTAYGDDIKQRIFGGAKTVGTFPIVGDETFTVTTGADCSLSAGTYCLTLAMGFIWALSHENGVLKTEKKWGVKIPQVGEKRGRFD